MDEPAADGIKQIKETQYNRKFKHSEKKVYAIGVSVSSKKRFVKELVWEAL